MKTKLIITSLLLGALITVISCKKESTVSGTIAAPTISGGDQTGGNGGTTDGGATDGNSTDGGSGSKIPDKTGAPEGTKVGNAAPDFIRRDKDGKTITMSSVRGKYTLLLFWGTWCGICMSHVDELKATYNLYKDKKDKDGYGFTIVGIGCDDLNGPWKNTVQDQPWINVLNSSFFDNEKVQNLYTRYLGGDGGVPVTFFVGPKGEIIQSSGQLLGDGLRNQLDKYMK